MNTEDQLDLTLSAFSTGRRRLWAAVEVEGRLLVALVWSFGGGGVGMTSLALEGDDSDPRDLVTDLVMIFRESGFISL